MGRDREQGERGNERLLLPWPLPHAAPEISLNIGGASDSMEWCYVEDPQAGCSFSFKTTQMPSSVPFTFLTKMEVVRRVQGDFLQGIDVSMSELRKGSRDPTAANATTGKMGNCTGHRHHTDWHCAQLLLRFCMLKVGME